MFYIATFYSHFGAMRFKKEAGVTNPRLMPVPRQLSSSCGTCVRFEADNCYDFNNVITDELEQIVKETDTGYDMVYHIEDN